MQGVPEGKVTILGGHSMGHSKQNMYVCSIPNGFRDEQHAMSSHEVQSVLMLTVEFSKMYHVR
jgi:hypothetical protein